MIKTLTTAFFFIVLAFSPSIAAEISEKTVAGLNAQWNAAFNSGDAETLASLYAEDGQVVPSGSSAVTGSEQIRVFFQAGMDNGLYDHQIEVLQVRREGDLLIQTSLWSAKAPADGEIKAFSGNLVAIHKLTDDGSWKMIQHTWN
ncbi:MAG: SgcJ/EcaC family oxidoreductase [Rhodospirillaceae bacterium]|jgi:uncharacterized protein (TIGR02246 family)|nr:SgcJ/EcaC family oxidoreductase [Rhodospirillaceae bacterium]MBT5373616.1 SgcJ/EcaC family oxidoreductase [Rhodospirillaceae bacterium]MBT5660073.1 SgcJ/EcaC family oxidoreductase [Rhodospirillaceae bacterium]MBT5751153.1 SgcJ/EcaC family oxidoreductase [Rhodospirillaceae bacterium]MBT7944482.1 SgcJ/EcaC family oxidoreductase [Alphaproteobacteria bacterium]